MKSHKKITIAAALAGLFVLPGAAVAGTITVGTVTGAPGANVVVPVTLAGDGIVVDFQTDFDFTGLTFVSGNSPVGGNCFQRAAPNDTKARTLAPANPTSTPVTATPTVYCEFTLGIPAATADGTVIPLPVTLSECFDNLGNIQPCAGTNDGSVTVSVGPPPDVIVTFTPASGSTVAFGGGMPGANVTQSIAIGNTGTIGTGTVSGCVLGGADAASFAITGGNPSTVPPATSLGLQATLGAAALNATLTCNVADSAGNSTATWTLTAPAGTVLQAPTLAANPASGTAITLPNSYGTPVSSNIRITPTGGDAGGPDASVACTATAGFTVTAATLTFTPPGGAAQNAVVGCTPGAAAVSGTVSCGGTDQAGVINWSWPVTCPAAQTAPPPPTFVPASSLWSKLALFGVFAALGMLILGLRRNH